jgi:hypothetical protein
MYFVFRKNHLKGEAFIFKASSLFSFPKNLVAFDVDEKKNEGDYPFKEVPVLQQGVKGKLISRPFVVALR